MTSLAITDRESRQCWANPMSDPHLEWESVRLGAEAFLYKALLANQIPPHPRCVHTNNMSSQRTRPRRACTQRSLKYFFGAQRKTPTPKLDASGSPGSKSELENVPLDDLDKETEIEKGSKIASRLKKIENGDTGQGKVDEEGAKENGVQTECDAGLVSDCGTSESVESMEVSPVTSKGQKRGDGLGQADAGNNFEREREERIRRNMEMLKALGVRESISKLSKSAKKIIPKNTQKKKRKSVSSAPPGRTYALRSRGGISVKNETKSEDKCDQENVEGEMEVDEWEVEESDVQRYVCQEASRTFRWPSVSDDMKVEAVQQLPWTLVDTSLTRIYSIDVNGNLLVAGGKGGHASIFGIQKISENAPVQFLSKNLGPNSGSPLLITAGNDSYVSLWDTSKTVNGEPQEVATTNALHSGGIFSLHEMDGKVLTGSKDGNVALSRISDSSSIDLDCVYDTLHDGVIKCVRWRDGHTFLSCGNDRCIALSDIRTASSQPPATSIEDAHDAAINFLSVSPRDSNTIISAAMDPYINLFDIRKPKSPVHVFQGHARVTKWKQIYQPAFWMGGSYVATGGQGTTALSLYCVDTGRTVSRGDIDFTPSMLATFPGGTGPLLAATTKAIHLYAPCCKTS